MLLNFLIVLYWQARKSFIQSLVLLTWLSLVCLSQQHTDSGSLSCHHVKNVEAFMLIFLYLISAGIGIYKLVLIAWDYLTYLLFHLILYRFENYQVLPHCCEWLELGHQPIGTKDPWHLSSTESRVVKGWMLAHNAVYATKNARAGVIVEEGGTQIERINDYYCARGKICGCLFEMRVCRAVISGRHGIVAWQMVDKSNDGRCTPIPHSNHKKIPFITAKQLVLSLAKTSAPVLSETHFDSRQRNLQACSSANYFSRTSLTTNPMSLFVTRWNGRMWFFFHARGLPKARKL